MRALVATGLGLVAALGLGVAHADEAAAETEREADAPEAAGNQEIGARLGMNSGLGGASPGGVRLGGLFLYKMDDATWFDSEAAFIYGGGGDACYLDRENDYVCDHGITDGFGMSLAGGVRVYWPRRASGFEPYVRANVVLSYMSFSDDEVSGVGLGLQGGAGGRFRVANRISVGGEALLGLGAGLYTHDLGPQPVGGLAVQFGVEFEL